MCCCGSGLAVACAIAKAEAEEAASKGSATSAPGRSNIDADQREPASRGPIVAPIQSRPGLLARLAAWLFLDAAKASSL